MKIELFEHTDDIASIYNASEHVLRFLGIKLGHFWFICSDFEYYSVFVWEGGYFRKCSSCGRGRGLRPTLHAASRH